MSRRRAIRFSVPAVLAIAALALTGCSGDDGKAKAKAPEEGPLQKYMGALWDEEEFTQEKMDKQNLETEQLIAECMTKEGFEYTPNSNNGGVVYSTEDEDIPMQGTIEFAKEYGYGIVKSPWEDQMPSDEEEYVDPNQDYLDSLSESERNAFYEALSGPMPTEEEMAEEQAVIEEGGSSTGPDWENMGCSGAAYKETQESSNPAATAYEDPEFADLFKAMDEMWNEVYNEESPSPEITKINREWSDCMVEAGYPDLTDPMAAQNSMYDDFSELGAPDSEDGEYVEPSKAETDEFAKKEMAVALADATCQEDTGYQKKQLKLTTDLEQKFVDEHKAALDALVSKYGAKKKD